MFEVDPSPIPQRKMQARRACLLILLAATILCVLCSAGGAMGLMTELPELERKIPDDFGDVVLSGPQAAARLMVLDTLGSDENPGVLRLPGQMMTRVASGS